MKRLRGYGPELLVVAGGLIFAALGRGRWADVLVDHGFCFSNAQGVLAGGRVLHEVRIQYGPVSVWLLVGLLKVFGARVSTVVISQFVIGLAAILGLQIFSRRFLSTAERWLTAALLTVVILWMSGPGNLLYPYRFAVSQALLFAISALLLAGGGLDHHAAGSWAASAGVMGGLAFSTKQEIGAAALSGIALMLLCAPGVPVRQKVRTLAVAGLASVSAYAAVLLCALHGERFADVARKNLLWPWAPVPSSWTELYRRSQGLDHPWGVVASVGDSLLTAAAFGGTVWLFVYGSRIPRRRAGMLAAGLGVAWILCAWRWTEGSHFAPLALCLPLLLASAILTISRARRGSHAALGPTLAIVTGALLLLSREGFRGGIEGFYSGMAYVLAIPASVPVLAAGVRGPSNGGGRRWVVAFVSFLLLGRAGADRLASLRSHWDSLVPLETRRGTIYCDRSSAKWLEKQIALIESLTRPGDPILLLPSAGGLDFLLDRKNMSFFPNMVPGVIVGEEGERELMERWQASPPRLVIETKGALGVFRRGDFGTSWARSDQSRLEQNYAPLPSLDTEGRVRVWKPGRELGR